MADKSAQRLEKLEEHIAHLERQVEQLNEVIIEQGKEVSSLKKQLQRQGQTIESIELDRIKSTNPKPPHYQA